MASDVLQRWCDPRVILVATNLDDQPALVRHAAAEAKRSGARLLLTHVIPPPAIPPPALPENAVASPPQVLPPPPTHRAMDSLERTALQLQWQGVLCEPVVLRGTPVEQIQSLARSRRVDRVMVAARGHSHSDASRRPSLAETLIAALPVPVWVVSRHVYADPGGDHLIGRILVALSLHAIRREEVDFACGLARMRRAKLTLLHVIDPSGSHPSEHTDIHETTRRSLAALAATAVDLPWRPDIAVREGDPAEQILEEAACPFRDLIILGSSSCATRSGCDRDGSVIARVLKETHSPVMTFRPPMVETQARPAEEWVELKTGSLG